MSKIFKIRIQRRCGFKVIWGGAGGKLIMFSLDPVFLVSKDLTILFLCNCPVTKSKYTGKRDFCWQWNEVTNRLQNTRLCSSADGLSFFFFFSRALVHGNKERPKVGHLPSRARQLSLHCGCYNILPTRCDPPQRDIVYQYLMRFLW